MLQKVALVNCCPGVGGIGSTVQEYVELAISSLGVNGIGQSFFGVNRIGQTFCDRSKCKQVWAGLGRILYIGTPCNI